MATDKALVMRTKRGDKRAYGELVQRHHARLIGAAKAIIGDTAAAEDVSQDALVHAYVTLDNLRDAQKFHAWLFGIMRHKALNHLRSAGREVPLELVADAPADDGMGDSTESDLVAKLTQLPERHREILAAKYVQDLSYAEIAELLNIPVNTVRVRCFRAKQALRELLEAEKEEEAMVEEATS